MRSRRAAKKDLKKSLLKNCRAFFGVISRPSTVGVCLKMTKLLPRCYHCKCHVQAATPGIPALGSAPTALWCPKCHIACYCGDTCQTKASLEHGKICQLSAVELQQYNAAAYATLSNVDRTKDRAFFDEASTLLETVQQEEQMWMDPSSGTHVAKHGDAPAASRYKNAAQCHLLMLHIHAKKVITYTHSEEGYVGNMLYDAIPHVEMHLAHAKSIIYNHDIDGCEAEVSQAESVVKKTIEIYQAAAQHGTGMKNIAGVG